MTDIIDQAAETEEWFRQAGLPAAPACRLACRQAGQTWTHAAQAGATTMKIVYE